MADKMDQDLISDVAQGIITQYAPGELRLFRATATAFFKNPQQFQKRIGKDQELGSGLPDVITFLTPLILVLVSDIVEYIANEIKDSHAVKALFKKFRNEDARNVPKSLTYEQILRIRQKAFERAKSLHLSDEQANLLADALIGQLVTDDR